MTLPADADGDRQQTKLSDHEILEAHPVATLLLDADGIVVDVNQAAESLLNRASATLVGRSARQLLAGWSTGLERVLGEPAKSAWAYSVDVGDSVNANVAADIALGSCHPGSGWRILAIHPVPRGGRVPFRKPGSAARSAGAAAAMLAHEVKNPLSGIRGAAQLLGKGGDANAAALSRLICGEVDRIAGLIDRMQGFTRDGGLARTSINIYPAIGQARGIAVQGFAARAVFIEDFDPSLPRVLGNHDALVQILLNLIKNAVEAAPKGAAPQIRLSTAFRHGLSWDAGDGQGPQPLPVEIIVADDGPGIAEALADNLFDPFVSGNPDGQGLGLALVDKLVRDMGGIVQHDRRNGWTRFQLHLPVAGALSPEKA
jgi:two-component system, NtrC family, nitrogen regulation sensor histidine kinase GlnL